MSYADMWREMQDREFADWLANGKLAVMPERTGVAYWDGWQTDPKWWKMLVEHCQREDIPVNSRRR